MKNQIITKPKFILLDAGNVLICKKTYEGDNIAKELGYPPEEYDKILTYLIETQSKEDSESFWNAKTLELETEYLNKLHKRMCEYLNIKYDDALIKKLTEHRTKGDFIVKERVIESLSYLSTHYRLGILSNALPSRRHNELQVANLYKYFDFILISWEEGMHKPNIKFYQKAVEKSGVNPEDILFVDDKVKFLEGAKAAGINNLVLLKNKDYTDNYPMITDLSELVLMLRKFEEQ